MYIVSGKVLLKGSCPLYSTLAAIAQLGERQTEDLKVPGSIPGGGITFHKFFLLFKIKKEVSRIVQNPNDTSNESKTSPVGFEPTIP